MTEPNPNPDVEPDEPDTGTDTPDEPDTDEPEELPEDHPFRKDMERAAKKRDAAIAKAAKLEERLRELEGPKDDEPSEADKLRQGMIRTAGRAVLAGSGITDKKDQSVLLDAIKLDGIEVDESGEVDTEALEDRLADLRRILGAGQSTGRRVPRMDTRDRGGRDSEPTDPDAARYRRIMAQRR